MTSPYADLHILVVDDDETQRDLMLGLLFKIGVPFPNLATANGGTEALERLLGTRRFDIVFTDNEMPIMDGPELIQHIREYMELKDLKVAMVSGVLTEGTPSPRELQLRELLKRFEVLPLSKDNLSRKTLEQALRDMTDL